MSSTKDVRSRNSALDTPRYHEGGAAENDTVTFTTVIAVIKATGLDLAPAVNFRGNVSLSGVERRNPLSRRIDRTNNGWRENFASERREKLFAEAM